MQTTFQTILARLKKWLTPPRSLRIAKSGWSFLGLTLVVGFAAVNTGNNLLYLVLGLMLSFITASGILSEVMLRKVSIHREFPRHIFAQQPAPVTVTLTNRKRYLASFSLLVEDFSQPGFSEKKRRFSRFFRKRSRVENSPQAQRSDSRRYVLKIPARQDATVTYPITFPTRGWHLPGKIKISTRYPFGFFLKSATFIETEEQVLVYPAIEQLHPEDFPRFFGRAGEFDAAKKGRGTELYGIREYVRGDGYTRIHWKSTAKQIRLMTKEFEDEERKKIALILDVSLAGAVNAQRSRHIERAISLTTSYILHYAKQHFHIQLITPEYQSKFDDGQRHVFALLKELAILQPATGKAASTVANVIPYVQRAGVMNILISVNAINGQKAARFSKIIDAAAFASK